MMGRRKVAAAIRHRNTASARDGSGGPEIIRRWQTIGDDLRLALAQVNPTVGDVDANAALAAEWIGRARDGEADLVVLPELLISGYPPEDLLLKPHFLAACEEAVEALAPAGRGHRRDGRLPASATRPSTTGSS